MPVAQQVILPAHPTISFRAKRILSFTEGDKPSERNPNGMAHLIRQGQEIVVEEDGGGGRHIKLVAISYSELQK